jgi:hypothetical protein
MTTPMVFVLAVGVDVYDKRFQRTSGLVAEVEQDIVSSLEGIRSDSETTTAMEVDDEGVDIGGAGIAEIEGDVE